MYVLWNMKTDQMYVSSYHYSDVTYVEYTCNNILYIKYLLIKPLGVFSLSLCISLSMCVCLRISYFGESADQEQTHANGSNRTFDFNLI